MGSGLDADPSTANEAEIGTFPGPVRKDGLSPCCCWRWPLPPRGDSLPEKDADGEQHSERGNLSCNLGIELSRTSTSFSAFPNSEPIKVLLYLSLFKLGLSQPSRVSPGVWSAMAPAKDSPQLIYWGEEHRRCKFGSP